MRCALRRAMVACRVSWQRPQSTCGPCTACACASSSCCDTNSTSADRCRCRCRCRCTASIRATNGWKGKATCIYLTKHHCVHGAHVQSGTRMCTFCTSVRGLCVRVCVRVRNNLCACGPVNVCTWSLHACARLCARAVLLLCKSTLRRTCAASTNKQTRASWRRTLNCLPAGCPGLC